MIDVDHNPKPNSKINLYACRHTDILRNSATRESPLDIDGSAHGTDGALGGETASRSRVRRVSVSQPEWN
jgi:hypothetical protein